MQAGHATTKPDNKKIHDEYLIASRQTIAKQFYIKRNRVKPV